MYAGIPALFFLVTEVQVLKQSQNISLGQFKFVKACCFSNNCFENIKAATPNIKGCGAGQTSFDNVISVYLAKTMSWKRRFG